MYFHTYADYANPFLAYPWTDTGVSPGTFTRGLPQFQTTLGQIATTMYSATNTTSYEGVSVGTLPIYETFFTDVSQVATVYIGTGIRSATTSIKTTAIYPFSQVRPHWIRGNVSYESGTGTTQYNETTYSTTFTTDGSIFFTNEENNGASVVPTVYGTLRSFFDTPIELTWESIQEVGYDPPLNTYTLSENQGVFINTDVWFIGGGGGADAFTDWTISGVDIYGPIVVGPGGPVTLSDCISINEHDFVNYGATCCTLHEVHAGDSPTTGALTFWDRDGLTSSDTELAIASNFFFAGNTTLDTNLGDLSISYTNNFEVGFPSYFSNEKMIYSPDGSIRLEQRGKTTVAFDYSSYEVRPWTFSSPPVTDTSNLVIPVEYSSRDTRGFAKFYPDVRYLPGAPFNTHMSVPFMMSAIAPFSAVSFDVVYRHMNGIFDGGLATIFDPLDLRDLYVSCRPGIYSIMFDTDSEVSLESIYTYYADEPEEEITTGFTRTVNFNVLSTEPEAVTLEASAYSTTTLFVGTELTTSVSEVASRSIYLSLQGAINTADLVSYRGVFFSEGNIKGGNMGVGTNTVVNLLQGQAADGLISTITRNGPNGNSFTYTTLYLDTIITENIPIDSLQFSSVGADVVTLAFSFDPDAIVANLGFSHRKYFATSPAFGFNANKKGFFTDYYFPWGGD